MAVREWTAAQRALMRWLCLPGDDKMGKGLGLREPKTLTALAEKLHVSRETLYDWQDLPGWDEALAVMAKQVTLDLEPEYLKTLSVAQIKPNPNDRLVTAYWRYIAPILREERERGEWANILPETTNLNDQGNRERIASEELRALPPAEREIILGYMSRVNEREGAEVLTEQDKLRVRRMLTEAEEKQELVTLAEEQEQSIVELKVLPANGQIPQVKAVGDLPRPGIATNDKWKPKRKSKRSFL